MRFCGVPVGLSENTHAKAIGFEHSGKQSGGETGMIDVGIAGHEDDIDGVPAAGKHFRAGERERWGHGVIVTQDGRAAIV